MSKRQLGCALNSLIAGQHTDSTALLHATQVFLGLSHVSVDLVHALLDAVQLLCVLGIRQRQGQKKRLAVGAQENVTYLDTESDVALNEITVGTNLQG